MRRCFRETFLLVYNNTHLNNSKAEPVKSDNKVLEAWAKIIQDKKESGYFDDVPDKKFLCKAIIGSAKPQKTGFKVDQCRASHYFYDYDIIGKTKNKPWFKNDKDYLIYYDPKDTTYSSKYGNIINLFLKILRNLDIKSTNERYFNKTSLFAFLREYHEEEYGDFKKKLYEWSKTLNTSNIDEIAGEIDVYFPRIIKLLPGNMNLSPFKIKDSDSSSGITIDFTEDKERNIYSSNGINISIGTVHSVKGETHTCTLYLESYRKGYESSSKIKYKSFSGEAYSGTLVEGKKVMKLLYVGLSRPTHLACYAIHETRYNEMISVCNENELNNLWQVVNINEF